VTTAMYFTDKFSYLLGVFKLEESDRTRRPGVSSMGHTDIQTDKVFSYKDNFVKKHRNGLWI